MGERMEEERQLTVFGATVLSLMLEKGVATQKDLARLMRDPGGEKLRAARISPWLYGVHSAPSWFPEELASRLNLSEEEMIKLAKAYTYGQGKAAGAGS